MALVFWDPRLPRGVWAPIGNFFLHETMFYIHAVGTREDDDAFVGNAVVSSFTGPQTCLSPSPQGIKISEPAKQLELEVRG